MIAMKYLQDYVERMSFMGKANVGDLIVWEDRKDNEKRMGIVRKQLEKSVIVDILESDDATVVSHKRYQIIP